MTFYLKRASEANVLEILQKEKLYYLIYSTIFYAEKNLAIHLHTVFLVPDIISICLNRFTYAIFCPFYHFSTTKSP